MRKIFCLALLFTFLFSGPSLSQEGFKVIFGRDAKSLHYPLGDRTVYIYPAFEDYAFMLFDVCDAIVLKGDDCLIYPFNGEIENAIEAIYEGNRIIVYDRRLSSILGYNGAMTVIAHEVGHHYCNHIHKLSTSVEEAHSMELEADRFAGAAMRRAGMSLSGALSMARILSRCPSITHPSRSRRIAAIREGWHNPASIYRCR